MPVDIEKIRKAFDDFVEDDFISSKKGLKDEIIKVRDEYLKDKLNLKDTEEDDLEDNDLEDNSDNSDDDTED